MAYESKEAGDKMWPLHVEHIFTESMLEKQLKGNMENGVFKGSMWQTIIIELNTQTKISFLPKKGLQKPQ